MTTRRMTTTRKKRKKTRIGVRLALLTLWLSCVALAADSYALIVGTVFRPNGSALPGAEVMLQPEAGGKQQKVRTDARGEFTFRVPAKPARYNVNVKVAGYRSEPKAVSVQGDERVDISILLEPEK